MTDTGAAARKLEIRKVIDTMLDGINVNRVPFLLLAFLLYGIPAAVAQYFLAAVQLDPSLRLIAFLTYALLIVVGSIAQAGMLLGAQAAFERRKMSLGEMLSGALGRALPYIGMFICFMLAIFVGSILLLVPGIIVAMAWSVSPAVLIFERSKVFDAFRRSAELTRFNRWRILGLYGIYVVAYLILAVVAGFALGFPLRLMLGLAVGTAVANGFVATLAVVVSTVGGAALYVELRHLKEGAAAVAKVFE